MSVSNSLKPVLTFPVCLDMSYIPTMYIVCLLYLERNKIVNACTVSQTLFIENVNKDDGIAGDQQLQLFLVCQYFEFAISTLKLTSFPEGSSDEYLWDVF